MVANDVARDGTDFSLGELLLEVAGVVVAETRGCMAKTSLVPMLL